MRLLHLADLHLDSPMRGLSAHEGAPDTAASCTREAFEAAVRFALEQGVGLVVISGDVYDGDWQDISTGMFFARQLALLRDGDIPVVVISGNHDAASRITGRITLPDGTSVLSADKPETVVFPELGVAVHGQSFATREVTENLAAAYPLATPDVINIGLLHTSLAGHPDHDSYAACSPQDLARLGYDYWALGHIHIRGRACDGPPAFYAGCTQGRSVREHGPHGGLLVELERGEEPTVEPVNFDVLRWSTTEVDCTSVDTLDDLLKRARSTLSGLLGDADGLPVACRVRLVGETRLHNWLLAESDQLRAELVLVAEDVATDRLWLGAVFTATMPPTLGSAGSDPELMSALDAALKEQRTADELDGALDELLVRVPPELLDAAGPLAWLADRDAARERVIALGRARLSTDLDVDTTGPGD
jgi:DNA repair exonuclease SbcCD nuclease subunit